jgi:type II secretory ATPase GspE/PulE/Tfp pilus assembly ATPase PilB-like protein
MRVSDAELKTFLADAGLLAPREFDRALAEAREAEKEVGELLVHKSMIGQDELRRIYGYILGVPFVSLSGVHIQFETLSLIPEPIARHNNAVAFARTDEGLEVALLDTDDLSALDFVREHHKLKLLPRLTDVDSIKAALRLYQRSLKGGLGTAIRRETEALARLGSELGSDLAKLSQAAPAVRIVDALLQHASAQGASDVHIEPHEDSLLVRYRIGGLLHDAMELPREATLAIVARLKALAGMRVGETRVPQEGAFGAEGAKERMKLHVSVMPTHAGERVAMRLSRDKREGFTLESLGLHGTALERVHEALRTPSGLILVAGLANSGKTTTLYTLLDVINRPELNVATVEEQIEHHVPRVNHTQLRTDLGFGYANGLRALLRQDPDVVMVGEIRDRETASLALHAALNHRLVIAGVSAPSAAAAVSTLQGMGLDSFQLASALRLSIAQKLVRRLCPEKNAYDLTRDEQEELEDAVDAGAVLRALKEERIVPPETGWKNLRFALPRTTVMQPSGFSGQLGLFEVLNVSASIKELILAGVDSEVIEAQACAEGMLSLAEDGIYRAAQGETTIEEVIGVE